MKLRSEREASTDRRGLGALRGISAARPAAFRLEPARSPLR